MTPVITIDGPAASGKSSVSRLLAQKLGWIWVSTGAFYRGLALVAQRLGVDASNETELANLAVDPVWAVQLSPEATHVLFRGEDVTGGIKAESVGNYASRVSQYPKVRQALLDAQRQCAGKGHGLVAEGRDCGTVVFPQAKLKVYLTASAFSRAQRRAQESGEGSADLLKMQKQRDAQDTGRTVAPLAVPEGALVIDSSEMGLMEVVDQIHSSYVDIVAAARHKSQN
jgi:cytidylate kinase